MGTLGQISARPHTISCVTLVTQLNLSVPQITHVYSGGHRSPHLRGLKEFLYIKRLGESWHTISIILLSYYYDYHRYYFKGLCEELGGRWRCG